MSNHDTVVSGRHEGVAPWHSYPSMILRVWTECQLLAEPENDSPERD